MTREGGDLGADAPGHTLFAQIFTPLPSDYGNTNRVVARVQPHGAVADEDQRANITFDQIVPPQALENHFVDLLGLVRHIEQIDVRRIVEPANMLRQTEHRGAVVRSSITTNTFEYAQAIVKAMGQHMNPRLIPGDKFTVEPDRLARYTLGGVLTHTHLLFETFASVPAPRAEDRAAPV